MARNITEFFQENSADKDEASRVFAGERDTEDEILADALNDPNLDPYEQDRDGNTELEEQDDPLGIDPALDRQEEEVEASEDDDGESPEPEDEESESEEEPQRNERSERSVPSWRLREERERHDREMADMRAQIAAIQRQQQQPQQPQQQPQKPDPFADPEGHERWVTENAIRQVQERNFNAAMAEGLEEHGEEFRFAHDELAKLGANNPEGVQVFQRMMASRDPVRVLMRWAEPRLQEYREQREQQALDSLAERSGYDRDTIERALAIAARGSGQRPQQPQRSGRNPPSLNSAGGSGRTAARDRVDPRGQDGSEAAIFADAFTPLR